MQRPKKFVGECVSCPRKISRRCVVTVDVGVPFKTSVNASFLDRSTRDRLTLIRRKARANNALESVSCSDVVRYVAPRGVYRGHEGATKSFFLFSFLRINRILTSSRHSTRASSVFSRYPFAFNHPEDFEARWTTRESYRGSSLPLDWVARDPFGTLSAVKYQSSRKIPKREFKKKIKKKEILECGTMKTFHRKTIFLTILCYCTYFYTILY